MGAVRLDRLAVGRAVRRPLAFAFVGGWRAPGSLHISLIDKEWLVRWECKVRIWLRWEYDLARDFWLVANGGWGSWTLAECTIVSFLQ